MTERPWWRQGGGQPPNPTWWENRLARFGFIFSIVWGGGLLLRLIVPGVPGGAGLYAGLTVPSLVAWGVGAVRAHRTTTE